MLWESGIKLAGEFIRNAQVRGGESRHPCGRFRDWRRRIADGLGMFFDPQVRNNGIHVKRTMLRCTTSRYSETVDSILPSLYMREAIPVSGHRNEAAPRHSRLLPDSRKSFWDLFGSYE